MSDDGSSGLLPEGFLIGVATAGFQIEGGFNGPGEPANNWVWWERSGRVEASGIACDFWRQPEQALDRAASLGGNAFRLSVEWARLEPEDGQFDTTALDRYADILEMCADRGMAPVVTLHHFTHPAFLGEEYWLTPGSPDRFAEHVGKVVDRLHPLCGHWITINEPNILVLAGWIEGASPPGRRIAPGDAWAITDNLLTGHVLAYEEIKRRRPDALVTTNTSASSIYDYDRLLVDLLCARSHGITREDLDLWIDERRALHNFAFPPHGAGEWALRSLFASVSPYGGPGRGAGRLLRSKLRRSPPRRVVDVVYGGEHERPLDASGFDWYDPVASHATRWPGHRTSGGRNWAPSRAMWDVPSNPAGLGAWCHDQNALNPGLAQWVVENGMTTLVRNGHPYPRPDGSDRPTYLREHVGAVLDAIDGGAQVTAYLHWSLVDNYEWGSYEPRLGIFGMDRSRGPRGITWLDTDADGQDAAGAYRRIIEGLAQGDRSVLKAP